MLLKVWGAQGSIPCFPLFLVSLAIVMCLHVKTPCSKISLCYSQRPRSGTVRPLSARVFMRRTSQRGWVAKAYPDPPSLTELDIEDDLSTSSSTDSFFDDDFDTCHQEEKLQNLLTCNTLGVESKVFIFTTSEGTC